MYDRDTLASKRGARLRPRAASRAPGAPSGGPSSPPPDALVDGRRARGERTRNAILDAHLELLKAGILSPSTEEIADRAGVTQRTLFHQFGDIQSLVAQTAWRHFDAFRAALPEASRARSLPERLTEYLTALAPLLEIVSPVRWAVYAKWFADPESKQRFPEVGRLLRRIRAAMRARLVELIEPELRDLPRTRRRELLEALEVATDPLTWRLLRVQQGLSQRRATIAMIRMAQGLVRDRRDDVGAGNVRVTGSRRSSS